MRHPARRITTLAALASLIGLSACVGAQAPGPVAYTPGYAPAASPGYVPPSYAPPVQTAAYGVTCYAGVYTCQLPQQLPVGAQCSCPGIGAPSFGNVR